MSRYALEEHLKRQNMLKLFFGVVDDDVADASVGQQLQRSDVVAFNKEVLQTLFKRVQCDLKDKKAEAMIRCGNEVFAKHPASASLLFAVPYYMAAVQKHDYLMVTRGDEGDKAFRVLFSPQGEQPVSYVHRKAEKRINFPMQLLRVHFSRSGRVGDRLTFDRYVFPVTLEGAEALVGRKFPSDLRVTPFPPEQVAHASLIESNYRPEGGKALVAEQTRAYRGQMSLPIEMPKDLGFRPR